ncbi:MAG TPA: glycoside hydrolase family 9 protein [Aggregatilineales bacterium]|nr:glycoside hydrolase family 9 protein [Aggregatilineales bacterium]
MKILTNHIGYESLASKRAIILGTTSDEFTSFRVLEAETGGEVYAGIPLAAGGVARWKDWHFWTATFDPVRAEGHYCIECMTSYGAIRSFPFAIQANLLEQNTLSNVLYYFKAQHCSGRLDEADHHVPFDGDGSGRTVDAHGGWYDATGDYGKHLSHLCFSTYFNPQQIPLVVWSLFESVEALKNRGDSNFNEYLRRLLDEAMFGADYLTRIKIPDGSFYIRVSAHGPEKRPEDRRLARRMRGFEPGGMEKAPTAEAQKVPESEYQVSYRSGGGVSIAALALASTFLTSGEFKSADYLKAAEDAFAYLEAHNLELTNDGQENILDDYCALLAATQLYKATSNAAYQAAAARRAESLMGRLADSGPYMDYWRADDTDRPFFHASDAGFPVHSLLSYLDIASPAARPAVLETIKKSLTFALSLTAEVNNPFGVSRQLVQDKNGTRRSAFFFPHNTEVSPWWQGENARLSGMAAAARRASAHFKGDQAFYDQLQGFAWDQLNWILGLNPFDLCMLHGSGRNNPPYIVYGDSYQFTNCPGGICNGITGGVEDEEDIAFHTPNSLPSITDNWRWGEQWLPHAAWYLLAVAVGDT